VSLRERFATWLEMLAWKTRSVTAQEVLEIVRDHPNASSAEIAEEVDRRELGARATAYARLASLQKDGLISAYWDRRGKRPVRRFRLTAEGEDRMGVGS
jgi:DNA-binding PadR family transcriptional regulator